MRTVCDEFSRFLFMQVAIYTDCVEKLVDGALKGYNATVLAYGWAAVWTITRVKVWLFHNLFSTLSTTAGKLEAEKHIQWELASTETWYMSFRKESFHVQFVICSQAFKLCKRIPTTTTELISAIYSSVLLHNLWSFTTKRSLTY